MGRRNFTEISRLGKERLFSGEFSQTLEIVPVFNENDENAEMDPNGIELKSKSQIRICKNDHKIMTMMKLAKRAGFRFAQTVRVQML